MSHEYYNNLWAQAQKGYRALIKSEKKPPKLAGDNKAILNQLVEILEQYVAIYKDIDRVYDQIVHPQKRPLVRQILDFLIARILEIRKTIVQSQLSEYYYPDEYIHWLHLIPQELDLKIPKYYRHDRGADWLQRQAWLEGETVLKEAAEKQAALDAEIAAESAAAELEQQNQEVAKTGLQLLSSSPQEDYGITNEQAVRDLQVMERARQGRAKLVLLKYFIELEEAQLKKMKKATDEVEQQGPSMSQDKAATVIQRAVRRFLAKRRVQKLREEELEFIGLSWGPYKPDSPLKQALNKIKEHKKLLAKVYRRRRRIQRVYNQNYIEAQETILERLWQLEAPEMEDRMKWQIRTWAIHQKEKEGKVPKLPKKKHGGSQFVFCPEKLDEKVLEKAKAAIDGKDPKKRAQQKAKLAREKALKAKKAAEAKRKKELAKKRKQKKKGAPNLVEFEAAKHLEDMIESNKEYNKTWRRKDETENPEQRHEEDPIIIEKRQIVGKAVRARVDEIMRKELKYLKMALDRKKLRKKKGKRKGKKKKSKGKKGRGRKGRKGKRRRRRGKKNKKDMTKNRTMESLYAELIHNNIIRKYPKVTMDDLMGEPSLVNGDIRTHNEVGWMPPRAGEDMNLRFPGDRNPLPTFGDIKRAVTDICILPMGSASVHALSPFTKSVLIAGPEGVGKRTLVNAVCTELGATLFDLSAKHTAGKYMGKGKKTGTKLLMHLLQKIGTLAGPGVILIDECEQMFQKRGLKPEVKALKPKRLKKALKKFLKKKVKPENPIILIGVTNKPWKAKGAAFKKMYDKVIYVPKPDYGERLNWWRKVMSEHYEYFEPDLNFSLLAKLSENWTFGSIQKAVLKLVARLKKSPGWRKTVAVQTNEVEPAVTETPSTAVDVTAEEAPQVSFGQMSLREALGIPGTEEKKQKQEEKLMGRKFIGMNDILQELSLQDPIFFKQEKAWTKWFNRTKLQKARLRMQAAAAKGKNKGKAGMKTKGKGRPTRRGRKRY